MRPESVELRFDGWTLNTLSGELSREGKRIRLQNQPLLVLEELLSQPGRLVTRAQLIARLWPNGIVEFDMALNSAVRRLRRALGDGGTSCCIETVPRRGYRFVGTIDPPPAEPAGTPAPLPAPAPSARLVDAASFQVWSETFDRKLDAILATQSEIAAAVTASIVPWVAPRSGPSSDKPPDAEAYQHFLLGQDILSRRSAGFALRAIEQFDLALAIDADYAEAYAGRALARVHASRVVTDRAPMIESAQRDVDAALAIQPRLAFAHAVQAAVYSQQHPAAYAEREAMLRLALALDPNMVEARSGLSELLRKQGRDAEADIELERAARQDPLSPVVILNLVLADLHRGQVQTAERRLLPLRQIPRSRNMANLLLQSLYRQTGRLVDAHEIVKQDVLAAVVETGSLAQPIALAFSYGTLGMWERAEAWLAAGWLPRVLSGSAGPLARQGRYREALDAIRTAMGEQMSDVARMPAALVLHYGALLAFEGEYAAAVEVMAPRLEPTLQALASRSSDQLLPDENLDALHALVWAYVHTERASQAADILTTMEDHYRRLDVLGRLHVSFRLFITAQNAVLLGDIDLAAERLHRALAAGWRDCHQIRHDPRWRSALGHPGILDALAKADADVAAQRARVEALEASEDFRSRLESVAAITAQ